MLSIRNLRKTYENQTVVDDVSLEFPHGKVISMIGPNGAGKSTVLGMVARLIARSSGLVEFQGRDITRWESRELARHLAILTQANTVQMKLTVRELVAFGRFPHSGSNLSKSDWEIVDRSIRYMELEAFSERFIDEMSGGQRQRAFIAMVLAQDTEYVLLDEPTNNLDIYHATQMMKLVRRLCDELGKTVILVLHEINLAAFYSDYICAFKDGRIAAWGTVDEVMTAETLKCIYGVDFEIHRIDGRPLAIFH
ncbi:ABC transporter ATP-binding protein [Sutterella sp.]|uniref:iron ABC transporter ATP-binding protein n=1 Tax=Sutterella sp. TaxID=1981025 RepID=UPI0026DF8EC4|nr:ATP-binding cassette domain-containing protein [Sutterella sp.]MDO5531126.1 ATP-binding cassette domain-containing protein [Sutterella sp.]